MPKQSNDASLGILQRFAVKLQDNRPDLAHMDVTITKFLNLVAQAQEAAAQQAAFIASKQAASRKLVGLITDALRLLTVLRVVLKEHYGIRSEKLAEFGMQPFRGRSRKVKPVEEAPPEVKPVALLPAASAESLDSEP